MVTQPGLDPLRLRLLGPEDGPAVLSIYAQGIATGHATFEASVPDWPRWDGAHRADCRLVAELGGRVVGFAALSPVSARPVYAGVAEVSIYVAGAARGGGVGGRLLAGLIEAAEEAGIWTLQAGIFPENRGSITLHLAAGFREVGVRERVGRMTYGPLAGRWRDVVLLERRSPRAGKE